jgi:hypothetical protein
MIILEAQHKKPHIYAKCEVYKTNRRDFILVVFVSALGGHLLSNVENDLSFGKPFIKTDDLLDNQTITYYKRFEDKKYSKEEIAYWF